MVEQDFQTCFKTLATMIGADNVKNNDNIMAVYDFFFFFFFFAWYKCHTLQKKSYLKVISISKLDTAGND